MTTNTQGINNTSHTNFNDTWITPVDINNTWVTSVNINDTWVTPVNINDTGDNNLEVDIRK